MIPRRSPPVCATRISGDAFSQAPTPACQPVTSSFARESIYSISPCARNIGVDDWNCVATRKNRSTEVSGLPQKVDYFFRVVQRVHSRIGDELRSERGGGKSPQVDTGVGKLLGQRRDYARLVRANDSNRVERLGDVETHLRGGGNFNIALQRRHKNHAFPRFLRGAPRNNGFQVRANLLQGR